MTRRRRPVLGSGEKFAMIYWWSSSWMRRSCGSLAETMVSAYSFTSSALGANMRMAAQLQPVREINRLRIPPVRDL